jgi:hypothetical protein
MRRRIMLFVGSSVGVRRRRRRILHEIGIGIGIGTSRFGQVGFVGIGVVGRSVRGIRRGGGVVRFVLEGRCRRRRRRTVVFDVEAGVVRGRRSLVDKK